MVTSGAVVLRFLPLVHALVVPALAVAVLPTPTATSHAEDAPPPSVVRSGVTGCRRIALTFDLCPVRDPHGFDDALVELLVRTKTPATFFPSGRWMAKHDDHVAELLAVPFFELGTHGATHAHLKKLDAAGQEEEIASAVKQLADAQVCVRRRLRAAARSARRDCAVIHLRPAARSAALHCQRGRRRSRER